MIEAMACGTPVLAFRNGSVPEVIDDGVTGYVVDSMDEAIAMLGRSWRSTAAVCADASMSGSPSRRMAQDYVEIYERLIGDPERRDEDISQQCPDGEDQRNGALNAE